MNQAAICKHLILSGGMDTFDSLIAATGLGESRLSAHLNKLCGEGTLVRDRNLVKIKNQGKCSEIAKEKGEFDPPGGQTYAKRAPTVAAKPSRPAIPAGLAVFKGVPVPEKRTACRPIALNFAAMEVGDCFLVPIPDGFEPREVSSRVSAEYNAYRNRINTAFSATVRITVYPQDHPQFGEPCVGIWRVQPAAPAEVKPTAPKGKKKAA